MVFAPGVFNLSRNRSHDSKGYSHDHETWGTRGGLYSHHQHEIRGVNYE